MANMTAWLYWKLEGLNHLHVAKAQLNFTGYYTANIEV